MNISTNLMAAQ